MAVAKNTKLVVLVDDDTAGRGTINLLEKELPGAVASVRTHDELAKTDRELEDLFAPSTFVDLVNASHTAIKGYVPIRVEDLDSTKPICDAVQDAFRTAGLGDLQKLRPAMEIQKRLQVGKVPDKETLDRFGALFKRLNDALDAS